MPLEQVRVQELAVENEQVQGEPGGGRAGDASRNSSAKRKITELKGKAREAERELERTKESQKAATEKAAERVGSGRRSPRSWRSRRSTGSRPRSTGASSRPRRTASSSTSSGTTTSRRRIQPGAMVFYQQPIFTLPDLEHMKVKVKIHESVIKKIAPGQTATLQVDALPQPPADRDGQDGRHAGPVGRLATDGQGVPGRDRDRRPADERRAEAGHDGRGEDPRPDGAERADGPGAGGDGVRGQAGLLRQEGPDGWSARPVEVGESNDQYIQILAGVAKGRKWRWTPGAGPRRR